MTTACTLIPLLGFLASGDCAVRTIEGGLESRGPNCAVTSNHPEWPAVWLGHFAGGRYLKAPTGERALDWRDQYACFQSRSACASWQRRMRTAYRQVEGYKTCLPIRGGPMIVRHETVVPLTVKY